MSNPNEKSYLRAQFCVFIAFWMICAGVGTLFNSDIKLLAGFSYPPANPESFVISGLQVTWWIATVLVTGLLVADGRELNRVFPRIGQVVKAFLISILSFIVAAFAWIPFGILGQVFTPGEMTGPLVAAFAIGGVFALEGVLSARKGS